MPAPTDADAAYQHALEHHRAGRLPEAEVFYRQVLSADPNHADAAHRLGVVLHQLGQTPEAIDLLRHAVRLRPTAPDFHSNLGVVLAAAGRFDEALAEFRASLGPNSQFPQTHNNIGNVLRQQGRLDEAAAAYRTALALRPDYPEAHNHLAAVLIHSGQPADDALPHLRRAIALRPDYPEAFNTMGEALRSKTDFDGAREAFQHALALRPNWPEATNNLAGVLQETRHLGEAVALYRNALAVRNDPRVWDNLLLAILGQEGVTPELIRSEHAEWNRRVAAPLEFSHADRADDRTPDRRLRIGYVSPDFREHPVGRLLVPLFDHHDHDLFEIVCYADVPRPDAITARLQRRADRWADVSRLTDEQLTAKIREDRIDILVDLALHTANNRLLVFARKPGPVQITWAGYPGTTGLTTIDYRLSDPYLDPPDSNNDAWYSEKTLRLPDCFWPFDPQTPDPPVNDPPALKNGYVTFGCLNQYSKIAEATLLGPWADTLRRVEKSRLLLLAPPGSARTDLTRLLSESGIDAARIEFADRRARPQYLQLYHRIDVGLDTFPYTGHTTTLDALWMGVPVVTRPGATAVSRGGLSILSNVALPDLIATDPLDFAHRAATLAANLDRLRALRATIRTQLMTSPIANAPAFARSIESAFRTAWRAYCDGSPGLSLP